MSTAEGVVKAGVRAVLDTCADDIAFFADRVDSTCITRAEATLSSELNTCWGLCT